MSDGPFHSQRQKQVQDHPSSAKKQGRGLGGSLHEFKRTAGENVFRHLPVRRQRRFRSRTDSAAPPHLRPFPRTGLCTTLQGATSLHPPPSASPVRTTAENGQKASRSRPAGKSMRAERCPQKIGPLRSAPPVDGTFADKTSENVCSTARRRVKNTANARILPLLPRGFARYT